jgi:hypothetical protein
MEFILENAKHISHEDIPRLAKMIKLIQGKFAPQHIHD